MVDNNEQEIKEETKEEQTEHKESCHTVYVPLAKALDIRGRSWSIDTDTMRYYTLRIDPTTIRRCTGLVDYNGTYVYEGDTIEFRGELNGLDSPICTGTVIYSSLRTAFILTNIKDYKDTKFNYFRPLGELCDEYRWSIKK